MCEDKSWVCVCVCVRVEFVSLRSVLVFVGRRRSLWSPFGKVVATETFVSKKLQVSFIHSLPIKWHFHIASALPPCWAMAIRHESLPKSNWIHLFSQDGWHTHNTYYYTEGGPCVSVSGTATYTYFTHKHKLARRVGGIVGVCVLCECVEFCNVCFWFQWCFTSFCFVDDLYIDDDDDFVVAPIIDSYLFEINEGEEGWWNWTSI